MRVARPGRSDQSFGEKRCWHQDLESATILQLNMICRLAEELRRQTSLASSKRWKRNYHLSPADVGL